MVLMLRIWTNQCTVPCSWNVLDTCQKCLGWTIEGHSFLQANVQSLAVWEAEATLCSVCFGVDVFGIDPPTVVDFKLPLWLGAGKSFLWCKSAYLWLVRICLYVLKKGGLLGKDPELGTFG